MKYSILILFFLCNSYSLLLGQPGVGFPYTVKVVPVVDSLLIIESSILPRNIPSLKKMESLYAFTVKSPEKAHCKLFGADDKEDLMISISSDYEGCRTEIPSYEVLENYSLSELFDEFPCPLWYQIFKIGKNKTFWNVSASDFIYGLKSGRLDDDDPRLVFLKPMQEVRIWRYITMGDFSIDFEYKVAHSIDYIYLLDYEKDELLFHAGQREALELYPELQSTSPTIEEVIDLSDDFDENRTGNINWNLIRPHLYKSLIPGKRYQLGIGLLNDPNSDDEYLFNFRFLTEEELEKLIEDNKE